MVAPALVVGRSAVDAVVRHRRRERGGGEVVIDASGEASVQMLDNPTNNAQAGTPTTMVSMWQTDSVAVRAIRHINWAKRRSTAVAYIKDAAYVS